MISSQEQISFSSPKAVSTQKTMKLSIFLYNITEETATRNTQATADGSKKRTTNKSFALRYLVTPFTGNDKDDHVLLEEIIHMLSASPMIASADEENNMVLAVKIDSLSLDELVKLWTMLGVPLRLSVSLTVSYAERKDYSQSQVTGAIEAPQTSALDTSHVTRLYQAVFKTFTEQSNDWKKRNILLKQWVLQDFKKHTDMTVEEMVFTLNNLGDKLEQHGSTAQFTKPLALLAGYYEYQIDQLKEFQKLSRKQRENIELIETWVKDVKTLAEALSS
jgi:hypothetical protein